MNNVALTLENFHETVVETSNTKLVLVAFWAEQIPESVQFRDTLVASLANYSEHILLATVDCQSQPQIAQQFGIQALPTAVLIKESKPLDGISGVQTDETIQAFLAKYLPQPEDILLSQGQAALAENNTSEAYSALSQAHQLNNERADINLALADVLMQTGKFEQAASLLATIKMVDQDSYYKSLMAKLELAQQAADSPEIQALEQALAEQSDNVELVHQLAAQYSQVSRFEDALVLLFRAIQQDGSDQASKTLYLDLLKSLPDGDPLATKYRRKLYTLMY